MTFIPPFNKLQANEEMNYTNIRDVVNGRVDDENIANGIIMNRQGGGATAWDVAGTTNYDLQNTRVREQVGSVQTDGSTPNAATVTFPVAFMNTPSLEAIVFTNDTTGKYTCTVKSASATGFIVNVNDDVFADWTDWTPTFGATGSMTWTSVTINHARYKREGTKVTFQLLATGTTGGTASNALTFTLPITASYGSGNELQGGASIREGSTRCAGFYLSTSTTVVQVRRYDEANFGLGTNRAIGIEMSYEAGNSHSARTVHWRAIGQIK